MGFGNKLMKRLSGKKDKDKPAVKKDEGSDNSRDEIPAPPSDYKYNFKYLEDLINSGQDEIKLEHDIILGEGEESKFPFGISVNRSIDGNGHSIDARGKTRIFVNGIFLRGECVVKNLTLKNGFVTDNGVGHGAAFENKSYHMTFINCTFENNCADTGGAVYNEGKLNLIDCTFIENSADEGGAIHCNYHAQINVKNCKFNRKESEKRKE